MPRESAAPPALNICIVSRRFPLMNQAGEIGFLFPIARGLVRQGHRVTVLAWRNRAKLNYVERDGVRAFFLGEGVTALPESFPEIAYGKFRELHAEQPFHLVHSLDDGGREVGRRRKGLGVAVVYDVDATHLAEVYSILGMSQETLGGLLTASWKVARKFLSTYWRFDRRLLKTADAVFVHSPNQRVMLERYYVYPDQRIFTVPFGIEVDDLTPRERSVELMTKLGLPTNAQTVVTITDMTELGEMKNLLWAFERLAVKKPTARLVVVGLGPLKKEIEAEMLALALGSRVIFTGEILASQLPEYIALADVFVNLSARSFGVEQSLLEAMAQRKVIIGSEVSPIANVVEDGVDGFLIRPADTFTLSELLMQVFNGQVGAEEMGEHARQKVMKLFDAQNMLAQTLLAYRRARARFVTAHRPFFSFLRKPQSDLE